MRILRVTILLPVAGWFSAADGVVFWEENPSGAGGALLQVPLGQGGGGRQIEGEAADGFARGYSGKG